MKRHKETAVTKSFHALKVLAFSAVLVLGSAACKPGANAQPGEVNFEIETVAEGFNRPWGMTFLPQGRLLVTERPGTLKLVDPQSGEVSVISGVPEVHAQGQGGLLDVAVHPEFDNEPWVYLTWAGRGDGGSATFLGRGLLDLAALELSDFQVLHIAGPFVAGSAHYGSRIVFDRRGYLYMTVGDRNDKNWTDHPSQDLTVYHGKTLRFHADGSIPSDNPFVNDPDARDAIYSYGHRNSQGMALHPDTGEIWQNEHGEFNGDEINVIRAGGNYGWPIATYAVDYRTRRPFAPTPPEVPGTIAPVYWWEADHPEGFPPSGFAFYEGDAFPAWRGHALMGNLAHRYLGLFAIDGRTHEVAQVGRLLLRGWRIRDVAVGPADGFVYVLIDDDNVPLIRLRPAE
jgi:glucose/arabinose dehydrogenase